jgi:hypothetical protein
MRVNESRIHRPAFEQKQVRFIIGHFVIGKEALMVARAAIALLGTLVASILGLEAQERGTHPVYDAALFQAHFELRKDPRLTEITQEDLEEQFDFLMQIRTAFDDMHHGLEMLRSVRAQVRELAGRLEDHDDIKSEADALREKLTAIENDMVQIFLFGGGMARSRNRTAEVMLSSERVCKVLIYNQLGLRVPWHGRCFLRRL